jgi:hypothetical protein
MRSLVMALILTSTACGGDGGGGGGVPDADPAAPMCTGVVYDNCTANTQCASNNCHLFDQDAIQICTQACDAANPCPMDAAGTVGFCNNKGICKPSRSNACRP